MVEGYLDSLGWICLLRPSLDTEWISKVFCQLSPGHTPTQKNTQTQTDTHTLSGHHHSPAESWHSLDLSNLRVHNHSKHQIFLWTCGALKVTRICLTSLHFLIVKTTSHSAALLLWLLIGWWPLKKPKSYLSVFSSPITKVSLYLSISPVLSVCPWNRV